MKDIHPKNNTVTVQCACGEEYKIESTSSDKIIEVDVCRHCHPAWTKEKAFVDKADRISKFKERMEKSKQAQKQHSKKKTKDEDTKTDKKPEEKAKSDKEESK
jgi:large subunit ribosomal protein L31